MLDTSGTRTDCWLSNQASIPNTEYLDSLFSIALMSCSLEQPSLYMMIFDCNYKHALMFKHLMKLVDVLLFLQ